MAPIRILHVIGTMNRGGAEVLLMQLYRNIDRSQLQFDFLVCGSEKGHFDDEILALGGRIYHLTIRFYFNPIRYFCALYDFFTMHGEYQCVHSHLNDMSGYILWMANKSRIKFKIAHSHISYPKIDLLRRFVWWLGRKLITYNADVMLGCSSDAIWYLSGSKPDNINRIVMKNAIDVEQFAFNKEHRITIRKELNADVHTLIIGNVARFEDQKNHRKILNIFKEVLSDNDNALLVLIGTGSLYELIQEEAVKLNIESHVKFLGVRNDVHEIFNAMDVFLMPSLFEGLGIVLIEAQANGLPCIASDVIPKEADINAGLIDFISLNEDEKTWRDAVLHIKRADITVDPQRCAKASGYDIREVATWLQSFYMNKLTAAILNVHLSTTNECINPN